MAILGPVPQTATTLKKTTLILQRWIADEDNPAGESAHYQLKVLDQNGKRIRWDDEDGSAIPHWTPELIVMAQALMDASWEIAEDGVIK